MNFVSVSVMSQATPIHTQTLGFHLLWLDLVSQGILQNIKNPFMNFVSVSVTTQATTVGLYSKESLMLGGKTNKSKLREYSPKVTGSRLSCSWHLQPLLDGSRKSGRKDQNMHREKFCPFSKQNKSVLILQNMSCIQIYS